MIISSKGRYALRVMLELAQYGGDGAYIRLGDIAQRQGISRKYLESIMTALAQGGARRERARARPAATGWCARRRITPSVRFSRPPRAS